MKLVKIAMLVAAVLAGTVCAQNNPAGLKPFEPASLKIPASRLSQYEDLSLKWMQEYLRIDTSNPPGNEARAVAWFKKIFDEEGIENQTFEYQPGRGNIWARIPASVQPAKRAFIMLNHMDVVTADASHWKVPPFSGEIVNGAMYGRGAQDMKCEGLAQLVVMVMLKREKVALDRDVIFLATSDEEVDDTGTDWMIEKHRELLENAEFLITEGGENPLENGKVQFIGIDVAEKSPFWLHIEAKGRPGHGSRPIEDSAPDRLVRALNRVVNYHTPMKVIPVVDEFMKAMAQRQPQPRQQQFENVRAALKSESFRNMIEKDESLNFMFRNTVALTMLQGSKQTNVIPGAAWANLDVRLLPGEDPAQFLEEMKRVVADTGVTVEAAKPGFSVANASPINTELFNAIRRVTKHYFPMTPVVPRLTSGYTENQRFRQIGIVSYGFSPYSATPEEGSTEHGDNERIRVEELKRGPRLLYDLVVDLGAN